MGTKIKGLNQTIQGNIGFCIMMMMMMSMYLGGAEEYKNDNFLKLLGMYGH